MSERLTAPARSPLRRAFPTAGKESPPRAKRSPIQRPGRKSPIKKQDSGDSDADALRRQAEEIEHDINHLSPAFQRFWQRAKGPPEQFSPRSRRLSQVVPKPKNATEVTMARLSHMRGQVADVIEQAKKVQELMSGFVKRHFETIPAASLKQKISEMFNSFDADLDGFLDEKEMKAAFASMGKLVTDDEMRLILQEYDQDGNGLFDAMEFEEMIRAAVGLPRMSTEED